MEEMELNRIWHEPEVVIYSGVITPGIRCSGQAYDLANRRWYQINVNTDAYDEEWMANIVENHISTYYHSFGKQTPFNVINATREDGPLGFETQPNHIIARPIREKCQSHPRGKTAIPIVSFDQLVDKVYLGRAVDRCRWKDQDCAFKRIEFDCDVGGIDREIKSREKLLAALSPHCEANKIMAQRFNVVPILAVVITEKDVDNHEVVGILMPFGGPSLESLSVSGSNPAASPPGLIDLGITREQLRDLACGVRELAQAGVVHGDINERNTLIRPHEAAASAKGFQGQSRLVLVDFGDVAPEYKNDAFALGELFIWCKERSSWGVSDQRRIEDAAQVLKENGDYDRALSVLDDASDGRGE
jgi:serine/threonine protein kinase